ncbi:MAG: xanthine dehydrogenase family protein subunit M [Acidobacteria bacterium]|nr:xanthine dehydrogenase family protein subunit M [Acidobacteriota bacterium]MCL5288437.1 xanthine dehydrogenase family protein subunit M [Acidobacteriota bacterium]
MIPAAFEYHAPKNLEEAFRLLDRHGDEAKLLAGGHSLLPMMKLRLAAPRFVIDLGRLKGLDYIREEQGHMVIGAMVKHAEIEHSSLLRAKCPLLPEAAAAIGDVQVRNRGTIGGSLAHADPAADYPAAILGLDAVMELQSNSGSRTVSAEDFFVDMLTTQLRPGEILTQIRVPVIGKGSGTAYCKLPQLASGYAVVGVAARVTLANGKLAQVTIGVTGVGPKAYRAENVENALRGKKASDKSVAEAARHAAHGIDALADLHASADYRREMAGVFTRRALALAIARAAGKKA